MRLDIQLVKKEIKKKRKASNQKKRGSQFTKRDYSVNIAIVIHRSILTCCHNHCRHCSFGTRFAAVVEPEAAVAVGAARAVALSSAAVAFGSSVIVAAKDQSAVAAPADVVVVVVASA